MGALPRTMHMRMLSMIGHNCVLIDMHNALSEYANCINFAMSSNIKSDDCDFIVILDLGGLEMLKLLFIFFEFKDVLFNGRVRFENKNTVQELS